MLYMQKIFKIKPFVYDRPIAMERIRIQKGFERREKGEFEKVVCTTFCALCTFTLST